MKRKLILLDLVLLAAIGAAGWRLRQNWVEAREREQALLNRRVKPLALPPVFKAPRVEPVAAAGYADIALKMLFSKDRNPTVVVEAKPAPPPKPMPPLPVLYGVMNLVDGTTVIMGEKAGAKHLGVRPGDRVGQFLLVGVNRDEITLQWDGNEITRRIDEMLDRSAPQPAAAADSNASRPAAPAPPPVRPGPATPGVDIGNRLKACQQNDASPPGTVTDGYKKVVTPTPFGDSCRWEPL